MKTEPDVQTAYAYISHVRNRGTTICEQCDDGARGGVAFELSGHDLAAEEALRVALEEEASAVLATLRAMTERH